MKYTIFGLSQSALVEYGLDITDAAIIEWFMLFYHSGKMAKVQDIKTNNEYLWVNYRSVIDDLPILGLNTTDAVYRHFKKITDAGVFEHYTKKQGGTFSCYRINENKARVLIEKLKRVGKISDSTDENKDPVRIENPTRTDENCQQKTLILKDYNNNDSSVDGIPSPSLDNKTAVYVTTEDVHIEKPDIVNKNAKRKKENITQTIEYNGLSHKCDNKIKATRAPTPVQSAFRSLWEKAHGKPMGRFSSGECIMLAKFAKEYNDWGIRMELYFRDKWASEKGYPIGGLVSPAIQRKITMEIEKEKPKEQYRGKY